MVSLRKQQLVAEARQRTEAMNNGTLVQLEHSDVWLYVHPPSQCAGLPCTVHNRSDHSMRAFPQHWRSDRGIMERICPDNGIGHPDPDDSNPDRVHGCDGCCGAPAITFSDERPDTELQREIDALLREARAVEAQRIDLVKLNDIKARLRATQATLDDIGRELNELLEGTS